MCERGRAAMYTRLAGIQFLRRAVRFPLCPGGVKGHFTYSQLVNGPCMSCSPAAVFTSRLDWYRKDRPQSCHCVSLSPPPSHPPYTLVISPLCCMSRGNNNRLLERFIPPPPFASTGTFIEMMTGKRCGFYSRCVLLASFGKNTPACGHTWETENGDISFHFQSQTEASTNRVVWNWTRSYAEAPWTETGKRRLLISTLTKEAWLLICSLSWCSSRKSL